MNKQELRIKLKQIRLNIENREEKNHEIAKNFHKLEIDFDTVLVYINSGTEVCTREIIEELFKLSKKVYAPKCVSDSEMIFVRINNLKDLKKGKYGILEPLGGEVIKDFKNSICLVPGLGFTLSGDRIGYGKAYYDRFLRKNATISIALCYNEQIIDEIPTQSTDVSMDYIVSDLTVKRI